MNKNSKGAKPKVVEVKMTKTARMRLLKANPLIKYQIEKTNNIDIAKNLNLDNVSHINNSLLKELKPVTLESGKKSQPTTTHKNETKKSSQNSNLQKGKPIPNSNKVKPTSNDRTTLTNSVKRSISAPRFAPKKKGTMLTISEDLEVMNRSVSLENMCTIPMQQTNTQHTHDEESVFVHPSSHRKSIRIPSPSACLDLRRRLSDWLERKQKNVSSFKHLKCFGVHKINVVEEENKGNFEVSCIKRVSSYEDLKIGNPSISVQEINDTSLIFAPSDLEKVAWEAVKDLNCLISEGYPIDQCEAWLKVIRNKCPQVVESPQYWECRATIENLRGDIGSAMECYQTAVVQGAEVTSVEQSLNQLLQKFKLLDIDSSADQKTHPQEKAKVMQNFKNVFTSMIIKFAIQEKTIKESKNKQSNLRDTSNLSSRLQVTPVRRSTRLSRSLYASTPGTKICNSLQELDAEEKQKMIFKPNAALYDV